MAYRPSSLVVAVRVRPVSLFVTVTDALGTAAPFGSVTSPAICPELACDCAAAWGAPKTRQKKSKASAAAVLRRGLFGIFLPFPAELVVVVRGKGATVVVASRGSR